MSADAKALPQTKNEAKDILRAINDDDAQSTTRTKSETGTNNPIRAGDENSAHGKEQGTTDADDNREEPVWVDADEDTDDDDLDDENAEKATQMVVTVLQMLDPDSVFAAHISNSSMRKLVTENFSSFALRRIQRAVLTNDYAELSTDIGFCGTRIVRNDAEYSTRIERVSWFFDMLKNAFVDQLELEDVAVNVVFAECLQKHGSTIRVRRISCVNVTSLFEPLRSRNLTFPLNKLFDTFDAVESVDLSRSPALLPEVNDKVVRAFTANTRVASLYLPKPATRDLGATRVYSPALVDFCFQQSAPQQDGAARAVRTLDIYAPRIDASFVKEIAKRYRANEGNMPITLNVHYAPEMKIDKLSLTRGADDTRMRISQCKRCKYLKIRLRNTPRSAPRQKLGRRAVRCGFAGGKE